MGEQSPNLVDYLTLATSIIAPAIAAFTTIWSVRRSDKDKFSAFIDWKYGGNKETGFFEAPFIYIHNHSSNKIMIKQVHWYVGPIRRKIFPGTALWWEDPLDLNFPFTVESGDILELALSDEMACKVYSHTSKWSKRLGVIGRSAIWIGISTVTGASKFVGGERAIPWDKRPSWLKIPEQLSDVEDLKSG
jgi:hypothetical protein